MKYLKRNYFLWDNSSMYFVMYTILKFHILNFNCDNFNKQSQLLVSKRTYQICLETEI